MLLILYLLLLAHQIYDYGLTVAADGGPQTCDDCMEYTLCPAAVEAANAQTPTDAELFRKGYCGRSKTSIPMVRCCVFPPRVENNKQTTKTPVLLNLQPKEEGPINGKQECDDCISYKLCPKAMTLAKSARHPEKFKNAFCGYDSSRTPKICCSDFDFQDFEDRFSDLTDKSDDPENHPRAHLLPQQCGDINGNRIVGGDTAKLYEFPWMTLISHNTRLGRSFNCGGSIINSKYILTAAHCVKNKDIAGVRIGEYDTRYPMDCQVQGGKYLCESHLQDILVEKRIVHEDFQLLPIPINDIALLRLKKTIDFSYKNAGPICLPLTAALRSESLGGKKATVAGWGVTENNTDSSILMKVNIPILNSTQCRSIYNRNAPNGEDRTDKKLCAGELNKDSCKGDSGGPLMIETAYKGTDSIVQYGIVSHGSRYCGTNYPGIYVDVSKYMGWILNNIEE